MIAAGVGAQGRSVDVFKALLVASIAMLACCAAAVLAGPVQPASPVDDSPSAASPEQDASSLNLIGFSSSEPVTAAFPDHEDIGFVSVPLTASYDGFPSVAPEEADVLAPAPRVQSAVIPLPSPLYAALALIGVALIARRAMLRAC
jgi:hypothetical protein